jgi:hypothetical protein
VQSPSNCFERKQTASNRETPIFPIVSTMPKIIVPTIKSPTQTRPDPPHSPADPLIRRIKIDFWSILCNSCAIASQLPLPKALSLCPRNMFFKIARTLPKTNVPTKKSPTQNARLAQFYTILHKFAQFCIICTNFAQFLHNRQMDPLVKSKQIRAQKDGFPHLVHNLFSHLFTQKIPYPEPAQIFLLSS